MKTKNWILMLGTVLLLCLGLSLLLLSGQVSDRVEVWSDGELVQTLSLLEDQTLKVESKWGSNTVTVLAGKVAVTQADCPDGHCMARGYCDSGLAIICLPNRLELRFPGKQSQDSVVG